MESIVCQEPGTLKIITQPIPKRKPGHALLKIIQVGVCGTDLHAYQGNQPFFSYPRILGHELVGEIVEVDAESSLNTGDQVAIMPYLSCGDCIACRNQKPNCCVTIQVLGVHTDGGMQSLVVLPENQLILVNHLTVDEAMIIEPLAIGAHAIRRAEIKKEDLVLVVGAGPIGMGIIRWAKVQGATVIVIDRDTHRLTLAQSEMGADYILKAGENTLDFVQSITHNQGVSVVFDATGNKAAMESGIDYMAHSGKYVLVGLYKGDLQFYHPKIHAKEASILCSRNATIDDFHQVIAWMPHFPTSRYITHSCSFADFPVQILDWIQPGNGVVKAKITF